ncbi:MAG: FAD binding domain-containing protein [Ardenticatenaceae bacterium]|nr:FAD binding domain-containing protein [Ardenticatenaceae bacterium]
MSLIIAQNIKETANTNGELRAGGTDLQERRRSRISAGPIIDIRRLQGLDQIEWQADGSAVIGAMVTIDAVANDPKIQAAYPGLAKAAGGLATPQIRLMGTMGGALLQHTRCPFYRHPAYNCHKNGGDECFARDGHNPNGVVFDLGPCVYPHPATLGMALLAYEAEVDIDGVGRRSIDELYGDGSDPTRDHTLEPGQILTHIHLLPPIPQEKAAYFRSISRAEAEWPIVECLVRLVISDDQITFARIGVGGVANIPLRLENVEQALMSQSPGRETVEKAAQLAAAGTNPLPQTVDKVRFLVNTVWHTLEVLSPKS